MPAPGLVIVTGRVCQDQRSSNPASRRREMIKAGNLKRIKLSVYYGFFQNVDRVYRAGVNPLRETLKSTRRDLSYQGPRFTVLFQVHYALAAVRFRTLLIPRYHSHVSRFFTIINPIRSIIMHPVGENGRKKTPDTFFFHVRQRNLCSYCVGRH